MHHAPASGVGANIRARTVGRAGRDVDQQQVGVAGAADAGADAGTVVVSAAISSTVTAPRRVIDLDGDGAELRLRAHSMGAGPGWVVILGESP